MGLRWKGKRSKDAILDLMKQHLLAADTETRQHPTILKDDDPELAAQAVISNYEDATGIVHSEDHETQIWLDENMEEVMAPEWEVERLRKIAEDMRRIAEVMRRIAEVMRKIAAVKCKVAEVMYFLKCIFLKCFYPKCIFAKSTRLACLLSFASLFSSSFSSATAFCFFRPRLPQGA